MALLSKQIARIKNCFDGIGFSEFEASWEKRNIAERSLQVAVEIVIDVAERIITIEKVG